jgi:phosphopantothenoylcysteine decarboxylase/phosphopantothenate--cysteine ligase
MNVAMWAHPAVKQNCATLKSRGVIFVGPGKGRLACGTEGVGRMAEVPEIMEKIKAL